MRECYIDTAMQKAEGRIRKQRIRVVFLGLICLAILVLLIVKWITPNDIRDYPYAPARIFVNDASIIEKYCGEPMYIRGSIVTYNETGTGEIEMLVRTEKGDLHLVRNMKLALFSMDHVPEVSGECNIFFVYQGWDSVEQRIYGNYLGVSQGDGEIFKDAGAYQETRVHFYVPPAYRENNPVTPTPTPTP